VRGCRCKPTCRLTRCTLSLYKGYTGSALHNFYIRFCEFKSQYASLISMQNKTGKEMQADVERLGIGKIAIRANNRVWSVTAFWGCKEYVYHATDLPSAWSAMAESIENLRKSLNKTF
jgi:hypothetical protein